MVKIGTVNLMLGSNPKDNREEHDYYATHPHAVEIALPIFEKIKLGGVNKTVWECACVDCETEYFNGSEWKKISEYTYKDKVLCFDGQYGVLLSPEKYHKYKHNDNFYHYKSKELDMMITPEHRIVYYHRRKDVLEIKTAKDVFDTFDKDTNGFRGKIPTTFYFKEDCSQNNINEWDLRLAIACNADGRCRSKNKNTYQIRVKKERKKERLELILNKCGINYRYTFHQGYYDYTFKSPLGCKLFPKEWIFLSNKLKEVFLDEIYRWDGHCTKEGTHIYFSSKKSDVDVVQMIAHSLGVQAKIETDKRKNRENYISYRVIFKHKTKHALIKNKYNHLLLEKSNDGYKYCFTVKTGMLILRRNDKIFITGNCGEGHISEVLKKNGYFVVSTDLINRGYGFQKDFLETTHNKLDIITNPPFKLAEQFVEHANEISDYGNKLCFLLKIQFLEGKRRKKLFEKYPPKWVIVNSERQLCCKNAEFEKLTATTQCYAWYVWEKGFKGNPQIMWI